MIILEREMQKLKATSSGKNHKNRTWKKLGEGKGYTEKKLKNGESRFEVKICIDGKFKYIGRYSTPCAAKEAYDAEINKVKESRKSTCNSASMV